VLIEQKISDLSPLAVSLSDKDIVILRPNDQGALQVTDRWHAHEFEPWIVAWNVWNDNILYSGVQAVCYTNRLG
jgi:diphthamide biosynthesis protein 7